MSGSAVFFAVNDNVLTVFALLILIAKVVGLAIYKGKHGHTNGLKITLLLCKQPWLPALIIIACMIADVMIAKYLLSDLNVTMCILLDNTLDIASSVASLWLFLGEARAIYVWLMGIADNKPLLQDLLPYIKKNLYFIGIILALPFVVPDFLASKPINYLTNKLTSVLVIWSLAWLIIQIIAALEKVTMQRFNRSLAEDFHARRIYTQARVFKRIAVILIFILASAMTAMIFDSIRQIGTSILASAGVATLVMGFAAQKTLGNLFAGMQIAITQPIRINDTVVLEGEQGTVEEISLTYVVIRIWDLRRLIVPINYFLEKPFQNLTRNSANLLCPIVFFADYSLPIEPVRQKFMELVRASNFWDKQVASFQVTDAQEGNIKVRALASARDSSNSWNLRCEVLEKLIAYIVENYPHSLPRIRNTVVPPASTAP
jgi:small-conductance mechanosensitive channel